jgi:hypothetical protein
MTLAQSQLGLLTAIAAGPLVGLERGYRLRELEKVTRVVLICAGRLGPLRSERNPL